MTAAQCEVEHFHFSVFHEMSLIDYDPIAIVVELQLVNGLRYLVIVYHRCRSRRDEGGGVYRQYLTRGGPCNHLLILCIVEHIRFFLKIFLPESINFAKSIN